MYRNIYLKNVAYFLPLFLLISCFLSQSTSSAESRFSTEPVSPEYFYWLVMISITFVQGALNGIIVLALRNYKHEYAGVRWAQAFWAGFPVAFAITHFLIVLINYFHNQESVTQLGPLYIGVWLALFLIFNFFGAFRLSIWAAQEN